VAPRTLALYFAAGLLGYAAVLSSGFSSDDFVILGSLRNGESAITWGEHQGGFLRPVTIATFWLDLRLHGGHPVWMHAENVFLLACCAVLVHALAARLAPDLRAARWFSGFAGLLFLVHPSHVECVASISGRGDLLAATLALLGIVLGVDHLRHGRGARAAGVAAVWTAAVFAKESALAAPGMFAALALFAFPRYPRRRLLVVLGAGVLAIGASFVARSLVFGDFIATAGGEHRLDVSPAVAWSALKRQALRTFVPALVPGDRSTLIAAVAVLGLLAAALLAFARRLARPATRGPALACALGLLAAYLCALVPAFGSKVQIASGEGERFVFLGTSMAVLGVAAALFAEPSRRCARAAALAWILAYSVSLVPATARWRSAGLFATRIIEALVRDARGPTAVILNLPDSVEGAYVFRNGLPQAVGERRSLYVEVVTTFTADRHGGAAAVTGIAEYPDSWELSFARRMPYAWLRSPELVERVETGGQTRVTTRPLTSFSDVFAFLDGELLRIGPRAVD
jgi:hypothetical protein